MSGISDEMLMAYADGELDADARAAVDAYLANVPDAAERLRVFQSTGRVLSDLFDQPMREPVPQRLLDAIATPENVVALTSAKRYRRLSAFGAWPTALAASVAILAVGGSAYWLASQSSFGGISRVGVEVASSGEPVAVRALAIVLDTVASRADADAMIDGQSATIKPVFTFATATGFCRQYVITMPKAAAYGGVACKSRDGSWRVEANEAFNPSRSPTGGIAPASGSAGPKSVEAAVDRMIEGDVLSRDAERAAMAGGWRVPD